MEADRNTNIRNGFSSFDALKRFVFQTLSRWLFNLSLLAKVAVVVFTAAVIFILARIGYLGDKPHDLALRLIPRRIPIVDLLQPDIFLTLTFDVDTGSGPVKGRIGGTYRSGNRLYLWIDSNTKCWLSIFSIDAKDVYGIYNEEKQPRIFKPKNKPHLITFLLDDTTGPEVYYAVASYWKFDFSKEIEPKLKKMFANLGAKGPLFPSHRLELGNHYYQAIISFSHE